MSWSISFQIKNGKLTNPSLSNAADGHYSLNGHEDENGSTMSAYASKKIKNSEDVRATTP